MVAEPLTFYFDFTCPYSYLGWELMQKARRKRSFPMTLIGIGPNPPGNPNLLGRALWSDQRWSALQKLAEQLDITICKPAGKISSLIALRGLTVYEGSALPEYVSGVFRALFRDNIDISIPRSLVDNLQTNGIDPKPLARALMMPETLKKVEDDMFLWGHERIRTLPTLCYGQERLAGLFDQRGIENFMILLDM